MVSQIIKIEDFKLEEMAIDDKSIAIMVAFVDLVNQTEDKTIIKEIVSLISDALSD